MFYTDDDIQLRITVNEDISDAQSITVCYKKPHATEIVTDTTHTVSGTTVVIYDLLKINNNIAGDWIFWLIVVNADGLCASSTEVSITITKHT